MNVAHLRTMTVKDFEAWVPPQHADRKWHLINGTPVCMAPAKPDHGRIMANLTYLLQAHLRASRPGCDVVINPGVIPNIRSDRDELVPDIAVTCEAASNDAKVLTAPVVLIEVLSPSNDSITRRNAETYRSMPSVQEILLVDSMSIRAEIMRRNAEQTWPERPLLVGFEEPLELTSIGFRAAMNDVYESTGLLREHGA